MARWARTVLLAFAALLLMVGSLVGWVLWHDPNWGRDIDGKENKVHSHPIPPRPSDRSLKESLSELKSAIQHPRVNWFRLSGLILPGASIDDYREIPKLADKTRSSNGLIRYKFDSKTESEGDGSIVVVVDEPSRIILEVQSIANLR